MLKNICLMQHFKNACLYVETKQKNPNKEFFEEHSFQKASLDMNLHYMIHMLDT